MLKERYCDVADSSEAEEYLLGPATAINKPWGRSLSWIGTLILHWTAIAALCLLSLALYAQVREINSEIAERVYCRSLTPEILVLLWLINVPPAPAQHLVRHENIVFTNGFGRGRTEYMGEPTAENEAAWSDLYNCGSPQNHPFQRGER